MASCDKVDNIEEAYTGEEVTARSLCFLPKLNLAVIVLQIRGTICSFEVQNGGWCGQYDMFKKKFKIHDTEADYLVKHAISGNTQDVFIDPWKDAGEMMVVDHSMLSSDCLKQWYLERRYNFNSHTGQIEGERIYDDCF